jgi:putative transposase
MTVPGLGDPDLRCASVVKLRELRRPERSLTSCHGPRGAGYRTPNAQVAITALTKFQEGPRGRKYAAITPGWRSNWIRVIRLLAYSVDVRRMIYTTNAIEGPNSTLLSVRARGHFPSDEAAMRFFWLQLREIGKGAKMQRRERRPAISQFALLFGNRFGMNH